MSWEEHHRGGGGTIPQFEEAEELIQLASPSPSSSSPSWRAQNTSALELDCLLESLPSSLGIPPSVDELIDMLTAPLPERVEEGRERKEAPPSSLSAQKEEKHQHCKEPEEALIQWFLPRVVRRLASNTSRSIPCSDLLFLHSVERGRGGRESVEKALQDSPPIIPSGISSSLQSKIAEIVKREIPLSVPSNVKLRDSRDVETLGWAVKKEKRKRRSMLMDVDANEGIGEEGEGAIDMSEVGGLLRHPLYRIAEHETSERVLTHSRMHWMPLFSPPLSAEDDIKEGGASSQLNMLKYNFIAMSYIPHLTPLPQSYQTLFTRNFQRRIPIDKKTPRPPPVLGGRGVGDDKSIELHIPPRSVFCLVCGTMLCLGPCCTSSRLPPHTFMHSSMCNMGGYGIYLELLSSPVYIHAVPWSAAWGALHLDVYGEEDLSLQRGRPLTLSREKVEQLEMTFVRNSFALNERDQPKMYWAYSGQGPLPSHHHHHHHHHQ